MRLFSICLCRSYRLQDSPSQALLGPGHCPGREDPTPEVHISVMASLDLDQSHSNCWSRSFRLPVCVVAKPLQSYLTLCNPWAVAPLSMGYSRLEYWSGLPFPSAGDLPDPGIKPQSPVLQVDSLPSEPPGKPSGEQAGSLLIMGKNPQKPSFCISGCCICLRCRIRKRMRIIKRKGK